MWAYDANILSFRDAGLQVVDVKEGVVPVQPHNLVLHPVNSHRKHDHHNVCQTHQSKICAGPTNQEFVLDPPIINLC